MPSGSVDVLESTATLRPVGVATIRGVGATFGGGAVTVTAVVVVAEAPSSSVTVRPTVYVPAAA